MNKEFPIKQRYPGLTHWIGYTTLTISLCCSQINAYALTGGAQQALDVVPEVSAVQKPSSVLSASKTMNEPKKRAAKMKQWLASPAFKKALDAFNKHPYLTYTSPSVFTPAGVPMKWGGIGFSAAGFSGYPVVSHGSNLYGGGGSVVLPVGDSDKIIGGAIAVSDFGTQTTQQVPGGNTGAVSFLLSRWLGPTTMATAGVVNVAPWGNTLKQVGKTYYGAMTQRLGILTKNRMYVMSGSFGFGTGAFAPLGGLNNTGQLKAASDNQIYPFANLSFNFRPNIAVVGDYYSETFALGLAYNCAIERLPLSFLLFAGNLRHTETAPTTVFGLRVSTGFSFLKH